MTKLNEAEKLPLTTGRNGEIKLTGRAVSRGIAVGKVVNLYGQKRQFYRVDLETSKIDREIRRFHAAIRLAKRQIKKIFSSENGSNGESQTGYF